MKMQIVALRDIKANVYGQPIFVPNIGSAIRSFGDQCQDEKSGDLYKHPEDFELYHLGTYTDDDAKFELSEKPEQIAVGSNYKR